jgi:hypothetical protein
LEDEFQGSAIKKDNIQEEREEGNNARKDRIGRIIALRKLSSASPIPWAHSVGHILNPRDACYLFAVR